MKIERHLTALNGAIALRQPSEGLIHHSDRGAQYCSNEYIEKLGEMNMKISMSRTGNPYDNACTDFYFKIVQLY